MHFNLSSIALVLLGVTSVATSPTSKLCGTEEECKATCENEVYHTETFKDSTYFACTLNQPVKYALTSCVQNQGEADFHHPKLEGVKALCQSVNGRLCTWESCIFIQTDENIEDYRTVCTSRNNGGSTLIKDVSYEKFVNICNRL